MLRLTVFAGLGALAVGCASVSTLQGAHTLGPGQLEAAVEPSMLFAAEGQDPQAGAATSASIRYGVGQKVDVFGRFGVGGTQLGTKLMLTPPQGRWALAVAPSLGMGLPMAVGSDAPIDSVWLADMPLLLGAPVHEGELVLGAKASFGMLLGTAEISGDPFEPFALAGGLIGFRSSASQGFSMMPELTVLVPLMGQEGANLGTEIPSRGVIVAFGIGFALGS